MAHSAEGGKFEYPEALLRDNPLGYHESVAELRERHAAALGEVRARLVEGREDDDVIVYRFLRGYKFDVARAAEALNRTLRFRRERGLDAIRARAKDMTQEQFPFADKMMAAHPHTICHGYDRAGQPVSLERIGHTDPGRLTRLLTLEQLVEYHLYHMEMKAALAARLTAQRGRVVRMCKVMDLHGLGVRALHKQGLAYLKHVIVLSQEHYPEMLGNLYVINAPWIFKTFWAMLRPLLNAATLEKIQILDGDFKDALLARIAPEHLPDWAGGVCALHPAGCVRERDPDADLTRRVVAAGERFLARVAVTRGALVSWEFRTADKDIGFAAWVEPAGGGGARVELRPPARVDAHRMLQSDGLRSEWDGDVVLEFDNSYSRFTAKQLLFALRCGAAEGLDDAEAAPAK
jgi:hypothetical protein